MTKRVPCVGEVTKVDATETCDRCEVPWFHYLPRKTPNVCVRNLPGAKPFSSATPPPNKQKSRKKSRCTVGHPFFTFPADDVIFSTVLSAINQGSNPRLFAHNFSAPTYLQHPTCLCPTSVRKSTSSYNTWRVTTEGILE